MVSIIEILDVDADDSPLSAFGKRGLIGVAQRDQAVANRAVKRIGLGALGLTAGAIAYKKLKKKKKKEDVND